MGNLGKVFYGLIVILISSILNSFVISKLWIWIIIPIFGLPEITMGMAFGISIVVSFFRSNNRNADEDKSEGITKKFTKIIVWGFMSSGFYLALGWLAGMLI